MMPVDQTIFEHGHGNCLTACVASILDLSIDEVPNFIEDDDMYGSLRTWLAERGWFLFEFTVNQAEDLGRMFFDMGQGCLCIIGGKGPRRRADGTFLGHAVVAKLGGWGVEIIHDPHPSRGGLIHEGRRMVWVFTRGLAGA